MAGCKVYEDVQRAARPSGFHIKNQGNLSNINPRYPSRFFLQGFGPAIGGLIPEALSLLAFQSEHAVEISS